MGFVRFGTGRDAANVTFATIFGSVTSAVPHITIEAVAGDFAAGAAGARTSQCRRAPASAT
jgi:hypothetical protein